MLIHICSSCERTGSAIVNGKRWAWEFHSYLGPTFLRSDGEPLVRQPGEKNPVWGAFDKWLRAEYPERFTSADRGRADG